MRAITRKYICRAGTGAAVLLYLAALALAIIGTQGLFGTEPDGLAAVFLIFVGLPWSLLLMPVALMGMVVVGQVLAVFMPLVNIYILIRICRGPRE